MSDDFWGSSGGDMDWDNFEYEDEDETIEVDYEVEDEDIKYEKESDVNTRRRLILKKGGFYAVAAFLLGVGNELFKQATKLKKKG